MVNLQRLLALAIQDVVGCVSDTSARTWEVSILSKVCCQFFPTLSGKEVPTCIACVFSLALMQSKEVSFSGRAREPSTNQLGGIAWVCAIVFAASEGGVGEG